MKRKTKLIKYIASLVSITSISIVIVVCADVQRIHIAPNPVTTTIEFEANFYDKQ